MLLNRLIQELFNFTSSDLLQPNFPREKDQITNRQFFKQVSSNFQASNSTLNISPRIHRILIDMKHRHFPPVNQLNLSGFIAELSIIYCITALF